MTSTITVGIGTFVAMLATLLGVYFKMKKEIMKETERIIDIKMNKCTSNLKAEIYPQLNDLQKKQVEMHTDIKWIIKRMNGKNQ